MPVFHAILAFAGFVLLAAAAPLTLELLTLSIAALFPARKLRASTGPERCDSNGLAHLAVIVPAHNEERLIAACVTSLRAAATPATAIYVVAHNCTDATAANARAAGASAAANQVQVLELNETSGHGKGAALVHGFAHALARGANCVLVIDADSTVSPNLIPETIAALQGGSHAVQCRYIAAAPASVRTRLQGLALLGMNVLRPRGRSRLSLSCGIFGNGFALTGATLARVPYSAHSVVEDLEYHLLLVRAGLRVDFLDTATVRGEMPEASAAARTQRARWEGGRALMRKRHAWPLLRTILTGDDGSTTNSVISTEALKARSGETPAFPAGPPAPATPTQLAPLTLKQRLYLIEPTLDLLAVPFATGVLLTLAALVLAWLAHSTLLLALATLSLATYVLYVLAAALLGEDPLANLTSLVAAPFYLAFKLATLPATRRAARQNAAWVRTGRNDER